MTKDDGITGERPIPSSGTEKAIEDDDDEGTHLTPVELEAKLNPFQVIEPFVLVDVE